jgi:hypothetical protein
MGCAGKGGVKWRKFVVQSETCNTRKSPKKAKGNIFKGEENKKKETVRKKNTEKETVRQKNTTKNQIEKKKRKQNSRKQKNIKQC